MVRGDEWERWRKREGGKASHDDGAMSYLELAGVEMLGEARELLAGGELLLEAVSAQLVRAQLGELRLRAAKKIQSIARG